MEPSGRVITDMENYSDSELDVENHPPPSTPSSPLLPEQEDILLKLQEVEEQRRMHDVSCCSLNTM